MQIKLKRRNNKFNFEASNADGQVVEIDANPAIGGEGKGFRPMEMMLVGLGGCSGIDMVNILTKQKEQLDDLQIDINAVRRTEEPPIFETIDINFKLYGNLNEQKVERALKLTFEKYCSVANILSRSAEIKFTYTINE
ncbi:MAG: OsmC family protein [Pedobacter sp.]|nr:OsmC family protein [Pedobacter sp.]MDQ8053697.1 OsmC family protein [Pedobacter sp.]